jgi:hypothetical protein
MRAFFLLGIRINHCWNLVIACDKREAFAQGSASDEAIHSGSVRGVDCFASLAITEAVIVGANVLRLLRKPP